VGRARIKRLRIDELDVALLTVGELDVRVDQRAERTGGSATS